MAGAICTPAATREYRENFESAMRRAGKVTYSAAVATAEGRYNCERCGKELRLGAECACNALRAGVEARSCERCGRPTRNSSARFCDYCEFHRYGGR